MIADSTDEATGSWDVDKATGSGSAPASFWIAEELATVHFGLAFARIYCASARLRFEFTGTMVAPQYRHAKYRIASSVQFGTTVATRSPLLTPSARRDAATEDTCS